MNTLSSFWLIYHQYCDESHMWNHMCVSLCVLRRMRLTWPIGSWMQLVYPVYLWWNLAALPCQGLTGSASNRCQICRAQLGEGHKRPRFPKILDSIMKRRLTWESPKRCVKHVGFAFEAATDLRVGPWYWFISVCEGRPLRSTLFVVDSRHV